MAGLASCDGSPPPSGRFRRLTPAAFGFTEQRTHRALVQIGDESREVLVAPELIPVADVDGVRADASPARVRVNLPEAVRALPDDAFVLESRHRHVDDGPMRPAELLWQRVAGWRLVRDGAEPGSGTLEVPLARAPVELALRFRALGRVPSTVESARFDLPDDAIVELGFGVSAGSIGDTALAVDFRASLRCGAAPPRPLVAERVVVDGQTAPTWHDAAVGTGAAARGCVLRLDAEHRDEYGARAVWAVPRVVAPPSGAPPPPNVVVISLDTLRADHLSGYGYARPTSPAIDARLLAAGTAFLRVSTVFPLTSVAHASLFTSLHPGARRDGQRIAATSPAVTLAERLRDAGYSTVAFTEGGLVAAALGLGFGFDRYAERDFDIRDRGVRIFHDGAQWVAPGREPFFLFLHTYKVHAPYVSGDRYRAALGDAVDWGRDGLDAHVPPEQRATVDAYDRAIREADDQVAGFLDALDRSRLGERTLVVLLSDHGEAFGEHGAVEHGTTGHEEQLHVPLVLRGPGVPAGLRIHTPASLVDVVPTVLDLLGLAPHAPSQGTSLRPAIAGERRDAGHPVYFSWIGENTRGVRDGHWKLLETGDAAQAFDLDADPHERSPLELSRAGVDLRALADARRRSSSALAEAADAWPLIDRQVERALRALGYL